MNCTERYLEFMHLVLIYRLNKVSKGEDLHLIDYTDTECTLFFSSTG